MGAVRQRDGGDGGQDADDDHHDEELDEGEAGLAVALHLAQLGELVHVSVHRRSPSWESFSFAVRSGRQALMPITRG